MITRRALSRIDAASSGDAERTGLVLACAALASCACPKAPNSTLAKERFIALHMITDRMRPEEALTAPAIISRRFSRAKPIAAQAAPAYEFSNAMTVGISPPPMG